MSAPKGIFDGPEQGEWLRIRYLHDRRSIRQIARERGCAYTTVWQALERHEIPRRNRGGGQPPKPVTGGNENASNT